MRWDVRPQAATTVRAGGVRPDTAGNQVVEAGEGPARRV